MAWQTLAEASNPEDFGAIQSPIDELPKGTKVRMTFETPWYLPIAPLADLFFAEWVADMFISDAGVTITDVEGQGFYKIIVHGDVDPAWVPALIWAIAIVAASAAIIFTVIKLEADIPSMFKWGMAAVVAAAAAIVVATVYKVRRKENGTIR